jgi:hypothetical protein
MFVNIYFDIFRIFSKMPALHGNYRRLILPSAIEKANNPAKVPML